MSLGKDSIQKRVAKPAAATAAKKTPARKPTAATAKKTVATKSTVLTNVAPETVEKVVAHKENAAVVKYSLGDRLPDYLL